MVQFIQDLELDKTAEDYTSKFEVQEVFHNFGLVQLNWVKLTPHYNHAWNPEHLANFFVFTISGVPIRDTLYRLPADATSISTDRYLVLQKYVEGTKNYLQVTIQQRGHSPSTMVSKKCLIPISCIVDSCGNEKIGFEKLKWGDPHIIAGSCIFRVAEWYFNIETQECYGNSLDVIHSRDFLFLALRDGTVNKINKFSGVSEIIE